MKTLLSFLTILATTTVMAQTKTPEITTCKGDYALCAASTCKPTGRTITGNTGVAYPEVECRCPILNGVAIADTSAGNMKGTCAPTSNKHVWSLFAPKLYYPQEANNFSSLPWKQKAVVQACASSLNLGDKSSNCFSWNCVRGNDGIAICSCPTGQIPANTAFLTEAGQGDTAACSQYPVSLPLQAPDKLKGKK
jgi:hypothetical protein